MMLMSKIYVGLGAVILAAILLFSSKPAKVEKQGFLASGTQTTEERLNLSQIKPLKPIAYLNRTSEDSQDGREKNIPPL